MAKKIVFVVGAGASDEFGFPLGRKLLDEIRDDLEHDFAEMGNTSYPGDGPIASALLSRIFGPDDRRAARDLLEAVRGASSIDRLLYRHRREEMFVRIGKMAIAVRIASAERSSYLAALSGNDATGRDAATRANDDSWLGRLFVLAREDFSPADAAAAFEGVTFVTFNYDRCIEFYLFHALRRMDRLSDEDARAVVASIPIHHAYGSLGPLPESGAATGPVFEPGPLKFGGEIHNLLSAADRIKTFREERSAEGDEVTMIRAALAAANRIVFLGFGFDELNLKLLFPGEFPKTSAAFGTVKGLGEPEVKAALRAVGVNSRIGMKLPRDFAAGSCHEFIRDNGRRILAR